MKTFMDNTKSLSKKKENVQEQPVSDTATNLQQALSSDSSLIPVPFIFIKSDLRLVIDLQTCIKAQGIKITKASVSPKASRAARAFQKLVAMGQRLMSVIRKNEGMPNKDLERFSRDIQSLCDKWDRDDLS